MEERLQIKSVTHTKIINEISEEFFKGQSFMRKDLQTAFTVAENVTKRQAQLFCSNNKFESYEYYATGRARTSMIQSGSNIKNFRQAIQRASNNDVHFGRVAKASAPLFNRTISNFKYATGTQLMLMRERGWEDLRQGPEEWIQELISPVIREVDGLITDMSNLGYDLANSSTYCSPSLRGAKRPVAISEEPFPAELSAPPAITTWAELFQLGDDAEPDIIDSKTPILFDKRKNLMAF